MNAHNQPPRPPASSPPSLPPPLQPPLCTQTKPNTYNKTKPNQTITIRYWSLDSEFTAAVLWRHDLPPPMEHGLYQVREWCALAKAVSECVLGIGEVGGCGGVVCRGC